MEELLSVGIDLGTTTTQMIVSSLRLENTAAPFTVPRMEITERTILYRSPVYFTPLLSADTLDAAAIARFLEKEYAAAGIKAEQIRTGAVIITGETARKENAKEVLHALSDFAGDFVVATAGPALESVLAAKGAGADVAARQQGRAVLHVDIGGGTANLALFDAEGELMDTGCVNVGGRLLKFDENGAVLYRSPVLCRWDEFAVGKTASADRLQPLIEELVHILEQACGLRPRDERLQHYITDRVFTVPAGALLSFSGGVADLMEDENTPWLRYGDLGVLLGRAIRSSRLCAVDYRLGKETIRATVVGAGSHATELSGSTVCCRGVTFPLQNLPVVALSQSECAMDSKSLASCIRKKAEVYDEPVALSLGNLPVQSFSSLQRLAQAITAGLRQQPTVVIMEHDQAKALGNAIPAEQLVCLDGLHAAGGSYLDLSAPVADGSALPVVIKTLAFS